MTWKPTEGERRADAIVQQYANETESALHFVISQMMRSRLFDAVAKAIDQALADGPILMPDQNWEAVGNGHVEWAGQMGPLVQVPTAEGVGLNDIFKQTPAPEPDGHALGVALSRLATTMALSHDEQIEGLKASLEREAPPAPKKRGRPKGSKAKKAKAAKAPKVKAEPEVVAEPVAVEAPAEEAAP